MDTWGGGLWVAVVCDWVWRESPWGVGRAVCVLWLLDTCAATHPHPHHTAPHHTMVWCGMAPGDHTT